MIPDTSTIRAESGAGLSMTEAAAYFGCSVKTLRLLVRRGIIAAHPKTEGGRELLTTRADLDAARRRLSPAADDTPAPIARQDGADFLDTLFRT